MALFSIFLDCFLASSSRVSVGGDDKILAAPASSPDSPEKNCESKLYRDQDVQSTGDVAEMVNNKSKGPQVLVSYFPTGTRLSCL